MNWFILVFQVTMLPHSVAPHSVCKPYTTHISSIWYITELCWYTKLNARRVLRQYSSSNSRVTTLWFRNKNVVSQSTGTRKIQLMGRNVAFQICKCENLFRKIEYTWFQLFLWLNYDWILPGHNHWTAILFGLHFRLNNINSGLSENMPWYQLLQLMYNLTFQWTS